MGVFNEQSREFEFRRGPAFANILLADELNRATPRTQSAMLECMDERQATVDGRTHALPHPFFVIATQNPIEQEGVYRLPEAQLDRFLMKIALGYPAEDEETRILAAQRRRHPLEALRPAAAIEDILESQRDAARIHVAEPIANYIVRIVAATRDQKDLQLGASPRASLALMRCCQALALITRQSFVTPDMVKAMAIPVLRHRLILLPRARISGRTADQTIHSILRQVEVPVCDYGPAQ